MSGPWLTDDQQRTWRTYLRMQAEIQSRLNRQLQVDHGLSLADYEVLVHLGAADGHRMRPFELGAAMQWEQSRLAHQLARMQRRGLVERRSCATDRRGAYVVLSEAGGQALDKAAPGHVGAVRRLLFDGLTEGQVGELETICKTVLANLPCT
ncbi:MAG: MarR family transcriptional regulator [Actinomycetota bacterium]|nr:MarR family transcriptional regulator [Actinomycetota bacterium]